VPTAFFFPAYALWVVNARRASKIPAVGGKRRYDCGLSGGFLARGQLCDVVFDRRLTESPFRHKPGQSPASPFTKPIGSAHNARSRSEGRNTGRVRDRWSELHLDPHFDSSKEVHDGIA
jgi:hypothetical protein